MNRIFDIKAKSNQYISNFDGNVVKIIESKEISDQLLDFNREQFIENKDADFMPLIHKSTGSQNLTKAYAKKTGKTKPNFFVSGAHFDKMILAMPNIKEYFITSKSYVARWLTLHYGKIYGVAPKNQPKAQAITDKAIYEDYMQKVFR